MDTPCAQTGLYTSFFRVRNALICIPDVFTFLLCIHIEMDSIHIDLYTFCIRIETLVRKPCAQTDVDTRQTDVYTGLGLYTHAMQT